MQSQKLLSPSNKHWGCANMATFTDEQMQAIRIAKADISLKVIAPPGSGKTTVLNGIANAKPKSQRGLYVSFAADNKNEAKSKLPSHVQAKTGHGLAWSVGEQYQNRLNERLTSRIIVNHLKINPFYISCSDGSLPIEFTESALANMALDAVTCFCQTADQALMPKHIPASNISDASALERLNDIVLFYAQKLWQSLSDPQGSLPCTHDVYLKVWALERPKIQTDYILLDEGQDTNDVLLDVILRQKHAQLILVGDPHQSIFQWRGAVNALARVKLPKQVQLTQSFRFGQPIADIANAVLTEYKKIPSFIKGLTSIQSQVEFIEDPDAIISRTNAALMKELLTQNRLGKRVGIAGGTAQIQMMLDGIKDLKEGRRSTVQDLSVFKDYDELMAYTNTNSGRDLKSVLNQINKYGISTLKQAVQNTVKVDTHNKSAVDIVLTTAHRSKGLEWPKVKLANDFKHPHSENPVGQPFDESDINLLYVAVSRAKIALDITDCEAAYHLQEKPLPSPRP